MSAKLKDYYKSGPEGSKHEIDQIIKKHHGDHDKINAEIEALWKQKDEEDEWNTVPSKSTKKKSVPEPQAQRNGGNHKQQQKAKGPVNGAPKPQSKPPANNSKPKSTPAAQQPSSAPQTAAPTGKWAGLFKSEPPVVVQPPPPPAAPKVEQVEKKVEDNLVEKTKPEEKEKPVEEKPQQSEQKMTSSTDLEAELFKQESEKPEPEPVKPKEALVKPGLKLPKEIEIVKSDDKIKFGSEDTHEINLNSIVKALGKELVEKGTKEELMSVKMSEKKALDELKNSEKIISRLESELSSSKDQNLKNLRRIEELEASVAEKDQLNDKISMLQAQLADQKRFIDSRRESTEQQNQNQDLSQPDDSQQQQQVNYGIPPPGHHHPMYPPPQMGYYNYYPAGYPPPNPYQQSPNPKYGGYEHEGYDMNSNSSQSNSQRHGPSPPNAVGNMRMGGQPPVSQRQQRDIPPGYSNQPPPPPHQQYGYNYMYPPQQQMYPPPQQNQNQGRSQQSGGGPSWR